MLAIPAMLAFATPNASAEVAPLLYGVNLGGGDATGTGVMPGAYNTDYVYPNDAELAYYQSKGLTLIRLPIKWKRIQDTLNGPLNETRMGYIDTFLGLARNRGMKVILDLHDYNEYSISGVRYQVGTPQVPQSCLTHLWGMLADRYKNETAIYGYDIMNEPKGNPTVWASTAQLTINAIREHDTQHWILVEGIFASRAWGWVKDGNAAALVGTTDPADKLIFSAHSYWDKGGSGGYVNSYAADARYPEVGIAHVQPFVEWCKEHGFNGLIGEYGVPWNKGYVPEWNIVLDNFMSYLKANGISGTYWCGGPWMSAYQLSCEPTSNYTVEKPVMSVLQNYNNFGTAEIVVDNSQTSNVTVTGSWVTSISTSGYLGVNYLHDNNADQGTKSVTFTPYIPVTGNYEVFLRWTSASNRAPSVPVQINHAGGWANTTVNQQTGGGVWQPVGLHAFNAGNGGSIVISNTGTSGYVIADAVRLVPSASLPAGWVNEDVGPAGLPGSATHTGGVFTVNGSGATIGGLADSFQFVRQTVTGDCTIVARVVTQTNTNSYARAGVMMRKGIGANAPHVSSIVTPTSGLYLMSRTTTGANGTSGSGGAGAVPYWLKVTRVGDVFTSYKSADGLTWTQMSTAKTITMGATAEVGLAVCAYANTVMGSATFDNVSITTP